VGDQFRFSTPTSRPAEFRAASGASGFTVSATAADPFGASAPAAPLAVRILNRPPVLVTPVASAVVGHRYDATAFAYLATAPLATFVDPDGDPLTDGGSTGDLGCAQFSFDAAGGASVSCQQPYHPGSGTYPTLAAFATTHRLRAVASDGWATAAAATELTIQSTPPSVPSYTGAVESCVCYCPSWEPEFPDRCAEAPYYVPNTKSFTFAQRPADADGDPLAVTFTSAATVSPASTVGLPQACAARLTNPSLPAVVQVTVNDGVSQATGTWTATGVSCSRTGQVCTL
jgi:hypothetical protein